MEYDADAYPRAGDRVSAVDRASSRVFRFSELSFEAQARVVERAQRMRRQSVLDMDGVMQGWLNTLYMFHLATGVRFDPVWTDGADPVLHMREIVVPGCGEAVERMRGAGAWWWLHEHGAAVLAAKYASCPLTGASMDWALLEPLARLLRDPRTMPSLREVFRIAADHWCLDAMADAEEWCGYVSVRQHFMDQDEFYEFSEHGGTVC